MPETAWAGAALHGHAQGPGPTQSGGGGAKAGGEVVLARLDGVGAQAWVAGLGGHDHARSTALLAGFKRFDRGAGWLSRAQEGRA